MGASDENRPAWSNAPPKLRKGLEHCPVCDQVIRPEARKVPHPETLECKARTIRQRYREAGWRTCISSTHGRILEEAGILVEWAPAGLHQDVVYEGGHAVGLVDATHDVPFAPDSAVSAIEALARVQLPKALRREAIAVLAAHPFYVETLDALKRLEGRVLMSTIRQLVEDAKNASACTSPSRGGDDGQSET